MMNENQGNDPDARFTEDLLRKTLGSKFSADILEQVREAEHLLIDRKNQLAALVDAGVMAAEQFAGLVNRVLSAYLRTVAGIVGEDACRRMYDFGPDDEVQLVNPRELWGRTEYRATPESLGAILADELIIAGNSVAVQGDENDFDNELRTIVQFVAAKGEWMIVGDDSLNEVGGWKAAMFAVFLANNIHGKGAAQLIWRVCEKTVLLGGSRLHATPDGVDEFYRFCQGIQTEPDPDMGIHVDPEDLKRVEKQLAKHRQPANPGPVVERDT